MPALHTMAKEIPVQRRKLRRPKHAANVEVKAWEIEPICIAPVLPGETLENLLYQARVISAPVKSSLVGWWYETYWFYCSVRQLGEAATFENMVLDNTIVFSATAVDARNYYNGVGHNWVTSCVDLIVAQWFRDQGEAANAFVGRGNRRLARINSPSGMADSAFLAGAAGVLPTSLGGDPALGSTQNAQQNAKRAWDYMRTMKWTRATFEDWIAEYGVDLGNLEERDRPELLRYTREYAFPTNVVEASTGVPSAALSWGINERADKKRFFTEPGFVVGLQVIRPKVYLSRQSSAGVAFLDRLDRWFPAMQLDDPSSSLAQFAETDGPYAQGAGTGMTNGYWLDMRDLFLLGDQFIDVIATTQGAQVALPSAAGEFRYPTEAMSDALFPGVTDSLRCIRTDAMTQLSIRGPLEQET